MAAEQLGRERPLGTAEKAVLRELVARGGSWAAADYPLWESRHWTLKLLCGLIPKDMVTEVVRDEQYEISTKGLATVVKLDQQGGLFRARRSAKR